MYTLVKLTNHAAWRIILLGQIADCITHCLFAAAWHDTTRHVNNMTTGVCSTQSCADTAFSQSTVVGFDTQVWLPHDRVLLSHKLGQRIQQHVYWLLVSRRFKTVIASVGFVLHNYFTA
jgi:hypothetical protein